MPPGWTVPFPSAPWTHVKATSSRNMPGSCSLCTAVGRPTTRWAHLWHFYGYGCLVLSRLFATPASSKHVCIAFCTVPSAVCAASFCLLHCPFCFLHRHFYHLHCHFCFLQITPTAYAYWVLMQASQERYAYKRQDTGTTFTGSYSQLLTGHNNSSMVLVPVKNQPERDSHEAEGSMHGGSGGYDALEGAPAGGGSAAPEPYQILMPVQMADGQMMALPADQAQVSFYKLDIQRSAVVQQRRCRKPILRPHSISYLETLCVPSLPVLAYCTVCLRSAPAAWLNTDNILRCPLQ